MYTHTHARTHTHTLIHHINIHNTYVPMHVHTYIHIMIIYCTRENVHQVGSLILLFETNFIITQLAIRLTSTFPLNIQFLKKIADGGRNVEVSRIASCVIMKLVSNIYCSLIDLTLISVYIMCHWNVKT